MTSPKQPVQVKPTPSEDTTGGAYPMTKDEIREIVRESNADQRAVVAPSAQEGWDEQVNYLTDNTELHSSRCSGNAHDAYNCKVIKLKRLISSLLLQQRTEIEDCAYKTVPHPYLEQFRVSLDKLFAKP